MGLLRQMLIEMFLESDTVFKEYVHITRKLCPYLYFITLMTFKIALLIFRKQ